MRKPAPCFHSLLFCRPVVRIIAIICVLAYTHTSAAMLYVGPTSDAPDTAQDRARWHLDVSVTGAHPEVPFWLYTHSDGVRTGISSTDLLLRGGYVHQMPVKPRWLDLTLGAETALGVGGGTSPAFSAHMVQLYTRLTAGPVKIQAGRFTETIGLNEHPLSMGSMILSRNALPIPKLLISTRGYVSVPGTGGFVEFKARFSEGLFEQERHISRARLHQKYLYLRVNPHKNVALCGGVVHNLMWGGVSEQGLRFHYSFADYLRSITGQVREQAITPDGNSIGAYDFAIEYKGSHWDIKASRLFYLEDLVSARFRSPWDGAWRLTLSAHEPQRYLNAFVYEFIDTRRQDSFSHHPPGRARYYWHFFYQDGWTYHNAVLGLPLITRDAESGRFTNNMLLAHHTGLQGRFSAHITYRLLATWSRNYGFYSDQLIEYDYPGVHFPEETRSEDIERIALSALRQNQFSGLMQLQGPLPGRTGWHWQVSVALDTGELYQHRAGLQAGLRWQGAGRGMRR